MSELLTKDEAWNRMVNRIAVLEDENQKLRASTTPEAAPPLENQVERLGLKDVVGLAEAINILRVEGYTETPKALERTANRIRAILAAVPEHPKVENENELFRTNGGQER